LRVASRCGFDDIVKLLIENGADIHANNDEALLTALDEGRFNMANLLSKNKNIAYNNVHDLNNINFSFINDYKWI